MESIGEYLKRGREQRAMSVEEVARETRIRIDTLHALESSRFDDLPAEVYVRGFLKAYARAVSMSVDETMARYTLSRRATSVVPLATRTPGRQTPRRHRLGMAIGFIGLLIFLTVALSLALKPSSRNVPSELVLQRRSETEGPYGFGMRAPVTITRRATSTVQRA
jgi:cytoskeletal protein RodZ